MTAMGCIKHATTAGCLSIVSKKFSCKSFKSQLCVVIYTVKGVRFVLSVRIKRLREGISLSQQKLADKLGVTQQAVAKWECDKAEPDSATLIRLSEIFNTSLDYLLGRTNLKNYEPETIAAHHDGEEYTKEELAEIEKFKEFVKMKREKEDSDE